MASRYSFRITLYKVFNMPKQIKHTKGVDSVYGRIREILETARSSAYRAVNFEMVQAYWNIGRVIIEGEQKGKARSDYGTYLLDELSKRLTAEFGKGFDRTNISKMRVFYLAYPIVDALRPQLTWTHYRLLLRVETAKTSLPQNTNFICRRKKSLSRNWKEKGSCLRLRKNWEKELFLEVFTEDSPFCLSQQVFEVAAKEEGKKSKGYCSVRLLCTRC